MSDTIYDRLKSVCRCMSWTDADGSERIGKCITCQAAKRIAELEAKNESLSRVAAAGLRNQELITDELKARAEAVEAALERVRGLPQYTAHVFADTETRSDGERTRTFRVAKVVLAGELAAALKDAP